MDVPTRGDGLRTLALFVGGLVVLGVLWATVTASGQLFTSLLTGRWTYTERAAVDRGTYFRLKVDVTYRGEPQHFDIVVGCNVLDIGYRDGSGTHEVGLVPTVYGRRMSDDKGLVVRVPEACDGETTANGQVPPNFMPVMIVYDDASTLGFGTAYMVDEAYDSPRSLMTFSKASVEKATRAEFVDFRQNGAPNLVTREQYHSAQSRDVVEKMGLKKVYPAFGRTCWAYSRSQIPQEFRAEIDKYWPSNRPKYWMIPDWKSRASLVEAAKNVDFPRDDGASGERGLLGSVGAERPEHGAMHRDGSQRVGPPALVLTKTPAFYPAKSDVAAPAWPFDPPQWPKFVSEITKVNIWNIDLGAGQNRGFAYCYLRPSFSSDDSLVNLLEQRDASLTVDHQQVAGAPPRWTLALGQVPSLFEEDKFTYQFYYFYLESTGGDV